MSSGMSFSIGGVSEERKKGNDFYFDDKFLPHTWVAYKESLARLRETMTNIRCPSTSPVFCLTMLHN